MRKSLFFLAASTRRTGVCRNWLPKKGFGFIRDDETGKDYFVHFTAISSKRPNQLLRQGEEVEFEIQQIDNRTMAVDVTGPGGFPVDGESPEQFGYKRNEQPDPEPAGMHSSLTHN
eukprot:PhF_6_TR36780/c0_g1_i1/m.54111